MSEESDSADKPFDPSPKKLEDARRKGEVPRSADLNTAAAHTGFVAIGLAAGPALLFGLGEVLQALIADVDYMARVLLPSTPAPVMGEAFWAIGLRIAPWFAVPAVFVVLSVLTQRSLTVAPSKLVPKLDRISPISGAKNKFGRKGLFEFAKSAAKLIIYATILAVFLWAQRDAILGAARMSPHLIAVLLARLVVQLLAIVAVIGWVIGGVDFLFQRAEHLRKHRMSRKEMTDELKNSEGDPVMKQQRRQRAVDIATNQMLRDVPGADVVVVNPTHYAVALKWGRAAGTAPVCVAKGVDEVAGTIRRLAMEHGVPIHADPPTARALHATVPLGAEISPDHYAAVAAAIRFADRLRRRVREGALG